MSVKVKIPQFTTKKSFEKYKQELEWWASVTDVPKKKQALVVALDLPDEHESGIREKVTEQLTREDLEVDDGMEILIKFLQKQFGMDELASSLEKYEDFGSGRGT